MVSVGVQGAERFSHPQLRSRRWGVAPLILLEQEVATRSIRMMDNKMVLAFIVVPDFDWSGKNTKKKVSLPPLLMTFTLTENMNNYFKTLLLLLAVFCLAAPLTAQTPATCYRLTLSDKNNSPYTISNPSAYLSERALAKRARFNIPITEEDFPVNPQYVQQVQGVDSRIRVLCSCKWLNTLTVYCPDSTKLSQLSALPFVTDILPVANYDLDSLAPLPAAPEPEYSPMVNNTFRDSVVPYDYGTGAAQIAIHNGQLLHNEGFRGEGMLIAMFDAGWQGVDTDSFFQNLNAGGQLLGTRDLIPFRNNVFEGHYHGTICASTMSCLRESELVGTAPQASYFFIRSEEPESEQLIEEDFWAQAAVIADSIGADVINSSLGYTTFPDFQQQVNTYAAMDGVSSIASLAATLLARKGVIVCISAGNEGANEWHYIGHPGDAYDVLTVGAADIFGQVARFSSRGPSYDGRVKPDITSVGVSTACVYPGDWLYVADGTSLAGPVAAGLCACLWQALPEASSLQVMQYIRENGSCYDNPNDSLGYGIPDFYAAYTQHVGIPEPTDISLSVFPNPCSDVLQIANGDLQIVTVELYDASGKLVRSHRNAGDYLMRIAVNELPNGIYIGKARLRNGGNKTFKVFKI